MPTDGMFLVGVASVVASVLGPLAGIAVANAFAKHHARRTEAAVLFRQIMEHTLNYQHAFLDQLRFQSQLQGLEPTLNRLVDILNSEPATPLARELFEHTRQDLLQTQSMYTDAFQRLRGLQSVLNSDVLALGLLFDEQSKGCGAAIRLLIEQAEVFNNPTQPTIQEAQQRLAAIIQTVSKEMKSLYSQLRQSEPIDVR